jgi:hypothetical protein
MPARNAWSSGYSTAESSFSAWMVSYSCRSQQLDTTSPGVGAVLEHPGIRLGGNPVPRDSSCIGSARNAGRSSGKIGCLILPNQCCAIPVANVSTNGWYVGIVAVKFDKL